MGRGFTGGEFSQGMRGERKGGEKVVGFCKESGDGCGGEGIWNDKIAIFVVGVYLFRCKVLGAASM